MERGIVLSSILIYFVLHICVLTRVDGDKLGRVVFFFFVLESANSVVDSLSVIFVSCRFVISSEFPSLVLKTSEFDMEIIFKFFLDSFPVAYL